MNPNKALWEKGDFTQVAALMRQSGEALVKSLGIKPPLYFESPDKSPADLIDSFRRFYGPTMNAFEAAEKNGKVEELRKQLVELANAQNTRTGGGTLIPATFLRLTVSL